MTPELIFATAVVIVATLAIGTKLMPGRKPASQVFQCSRCGSASRHNDRTTEAWRSGKSKLFCQSCHAKWLQSQPPREREARPGRAASGNSGCLGVVVLFTSLPLAGLLMWAYA